MTDKPVPLSLRRKSSARLAAVQCIYRLRINDDTISPAELFDDYMKQWKDDKDSPNRAMSFDAEPEKALFLKLIAGVMEHKESLETTIQAALNNKWKLERMSALLVSILACAIYELKHAQKLKPPIVVNEYVTIAGRFFEPQEVGFVNGILDNLAK